MPIKPISGSSDPSIMPVLLESLQHLKWSSLANLSLVWLFWEKKNIVLLAEARASYELEPFWKGAPLYR